MKPDEIGRARVPSDAQITTDGRIVFVLTQMNVDDDKYQRDLWLSDADGVRRFTTGGSDTHPRWSPDGSHIAFLRKVDKASQLALIPAGGGEARILTDLALGVEGFEWSPDGSHLAAVGVTWVEEWADLTDEERTKKPRRMTSVPYRFDNLGWVHDRRRHIWLVPAEGGEVRCLTPGDFDERFPAWAPDGRTIATITDRSEGRGLEPGSDVVEIEIETGDVTVAVPRGNWILPAYGPDGRLHLMGDESVEWPGIFTVWRREDDASLTPLTRHLDRASTSLAAGLPKMQFVGDDIVTGLEDAGSYGVIRVGPDGTVHHLVTGQRTASSFDTRDGKILALTISEMTKPGDLVRWADGNEEVLTDFNADLDLVDGHHFRVPSGGVEIDAWVFMPKGEAVPGLVNVHGGPASQYGFGYFDEFQVYAAAGYAVIACNPRGSSGRGLDFVTAVVGDDWGVVDRADVGAVVDAALERFPQIDADRLGLMGGSYGGYMTGWLTAHEDRWKSAVVERALLSFTSFAGTSDIGAIFPRAYLKDDYPDGWKTWWERSPLAYVDQVATPTLVLHSEDDHRCPIEQAEQWFMALLRNGVPTELLRFPGESHELSRSGGVAHRVERFQAILDWHNRHL